MLSRGFTAARDRQSTAQHAPIPVQCKFTLFRRAQAGYTVKRLKNTQEITVHAKLNPNLSLPFLHNLATRNKKKHDIFHVSYRWVQKRRPTAKPLLFFYQLNFVTQHVVVYRSVSYKQQTKIKPQLRSTRLGCFTSTVSLQLQKKFARKTDRRQNRVSLISNKRAKHTVAKARQFERRVALMAGLSRLVGFSGTVADAGARIQVEMHQYVRRVASKVSLLYCRSHPLPARFLKLSSRALTATRDCDFPRLYRKRTLKVG